MTELVMTRGYPGSGKSVAAEAWVSEDPQNRTVLSRDGLREMLFGLDLNIVGVGSKKQERLVSAAQSAMAESFLRDGVSVVIDGTNLEKRFAQEWANLAGRLGVGFRVVDIETPLDECLRRNQLRDRQVPEKVIRRFAQRFPMPWRKLEPSFEFRDLPRYEPDPDLTPAYIFDIDGTLADCTGVRNPYDGSKVHLDKPIQPTIDVLRGLIHGDYFYDPVLIVLSGRDEKHRPATLEWLRIHSADPALLLMRPEGDKRRDSEVKFELFQSVADRFNVLGVFDDRLQVCRMWHRIGVPLFRVGDPDSNF